MKRPHEVLSTPVLLGTTMHPKRGMLTDKTNLENNSNATESPSDFVRAAMPSAKRQRVKARFDQEWMDRYDCETVSAIRSNDISTLRSLLEEGKSFDACNSNGETVLHLACRRGNLETVKFLIHEAQVQVDVQDGMGRTALHDACWRPTPDTEILKAVMNVLPPEVLLIEDERGHLCFDYCRKDHRELWVGFLQGEAANILKRQTSHVADLAPSA